MADLPARYEALDRLGAGGGGEVWSVRDRVSGRVLALKVLSGDAGDSEVGALVREAVALSGLEGLGLPRVIAFGALADARKYMVRELVEGRSLDDILQQDEAAEWLEPIASACDELTAVHRAGLLHGDVKPANIIVGAGGRGTLVDMGLAAPWRDGGTAARGLTPKYAAPELFRGEPLTVRAEVYALGATLSEGLARKGDTLPDGVRLALARVAARATDPDPAARWPSVDELGSALRDAAALPPSAPSAEPPWPVVGLDATAQALTDAVRALAPGDALVVQGRSGSGRTTLLRRLAWTLGVEGRAVVFIEGRRDGKPMAADAVDVELGQGKPDGLIVIVDDAHRLDPAARAALARASEDGARLIVVAPRASLTSMTKRGIATFLMPPLDPESACELLGRSMPSLPDGLRMRLVQRVGGRPGPLRAAVRKLAGRAIVSDEDVESALAAPESSPSVVPQSRAETLDEAERALDLGRFDDAGRALGELGTPIGAAESLRVGLARARMAVGRGDPSAALAELAGVEGAALSGEYARPWCLLHARASLRAGSYADAAESARRVTEGAGDDALSAEAMSVRGLALAFTGEDGPAREALDAGVRIARALGEPRVEAVALGSSAIAHQRAGRANDARAAYEASLAAAERARDAATVAATRLNLAGLARAEGELSHAITHLEAAVDMGKRAGSGAAVTQALLNLANLDLYLGRWARARSSIDRLKARRDELSHASRAQLLGLEAEYATRTGDTAKAATLYEETAQAWDSQGRPHDAAEARLEGMLARAREPGADAPVLSVELARVRSALGETGLGEHAALADLVRGSIAQLAGDEDGARRALDAAIDRATKGGHKEWAWQALYGRARLAAVQGSVATALRDTEAALAMLEETAGKLPRDLREVF
ncbi:MAG TPA: protein kinase, partial [Polyangiaceae bacterium]|nr:protein kinase [Polyangiaceae bacterium]